MSAGLLRSTHRSSIAPASSTATRPHPTRPHPTLLRALAAALAASLTSLASAACTLPAPGEARDAPDARSRTASLACTRRVAAWARRVAASSTWGCSPGAWGCGLASSASESVSASAATAISAAATAPPSAGLRGGGGGGGGGCRPRAFASRSPPPAADTATSAFAAAVDRFRGDRGWPPWTCRVCSRSSMAPRDACARALASRRSSAATSPPSSVHATRACERIGLQAGLHRVAASMAWGCSLRHTGLQRARGAHRRLLVRQFGPQHAQVHLQPHASRL